jgi:hypothetical protein
VVPLPRPAADLECYETMVREPAPFLANGGELILLADGSVWKEISYQYLYLYEYYPSVILCPGQGKLILGKHILQVVPMR